MKTLFIGGPRDGQWLDIPDEREMVQFAPRLTALENDKFKPETYMRYVWRYGRGGSDPVESCVFAYVHESVVNPAEALIAGYRPGEAIAAKLDFVTSPDPSVRRVALAAVPSDGAAAREKVNQWQCAAYRSEGIVTIVLPPEVTR